MGCMIGNQRQVDELKKQYPTVDLFFKVEQADILPTFLEERWTPIAGEGCVDFAELGAPRTFGLTDRLPVLPMIQPQDEGGLPKRQWRSRRAAPSGPMTVNFRPGARELHYPTRRGPGFKREEPDRLAAGHPRLQQGLLVLHRALAPWTRAQPSHG